MEIKSSLLNSDDFKYVKDSLIKASEVDHKEVWRTKLVEYIDMTASDENDEFFYDMMEAIRFLIPDKETTAYTDTNHLIYMNAPGVFGENKKYWDFTYCHECLHQMWDTFKVGEKIKSEGKKLNFFILNIASDCVINDYLSVLRKKTMPEGLVTPEYLKTNFDVTYDRKKDTQYTLYLKLLKKAEELAKDKNLQQQCGDETSDPNNQNSQPKKSNNQGEQQENGDKSDNQQGNSDKSNDLNKSPEQKAKDLADHAKRMADAAQDKANKAKENGDKDANKKQEAADKAKKAADKAKEAADKAKEAAKNKNKKEAEEEAKKSEEAAKEAEEAAKEAGVETTSSNEPDVKSDNNDDSKSSVGDQKGSHEISDQDLEKIKKKLEGVINKHKDKISGELSKFIKQCNKSLKLDENGLEIGGTTKGQRGWNDTMNSHIITYVKNKVFQKQRMYKKTYQRVKRGSGIVKMGQPITPGKKIRDEKLTINPAFYIDSSGSMSSNINNVWDATYEICEKLKKHFSREKVVDQVIFKLYSFEYDITEIKYGKRTTAGGGTMSFHSLLKEILEHSKENLINIIITDGEFEVSESEVKKFMDELDGLLIYITNKTNSANNKIKRLADEYKLKLKYIAADPTFKIN